MPGKLTAGKVASFTCNDPKKPAFLWDSLAKGLGVKASPGGAKNYVLEARMHGKTLRLTIGDTRTWPLDGPAGSQHNARAEARRLMALIDQGFDPRKLMAEQQAQANAQSAEIARQSVTLATAWASYIENRQHKWSTRHKADHEAVADPGGQPAKRGNKLTAPGPLAALMPLKMAQIDANRIKAWLTKEVKKRPTRARLAFNLLRAFINWCETIPEYRGIVPQDAVDTRIAKDSLPKKAAKDDCLQREQLSAWFAAVRAIPNTTISAYLQILLLTGARRESLALLRWEEVDFRWQKLIIRDKEESRGGENGTRTIPLTPYVSALLSKLKSINETPPSKYRILHGKKIENDLKSWKPSQWVFASKRAKKTEGRLSDPTQAHYKACAVARLEGLTLHGLRRSFSTLSEWCEVPTGVVAQIMGHKPSATAERHYKRRSVDLLRLWHTRIESWILDQAGIVLPAQPESTTELTAGIQKSNQNENRI